MELHDVLITTPAVDLVHVCGIYFITQRSCLEPLALFPVI